MKADEYSGPYIPVWSGGTIAALVKVDPEDFEILPDRGWYLSGPNLTQVQRDYGARPNRRKIKMHRVIMGVQDADPKILVDHINGDRFDNRRSNLRLVTYAENNQNRHGARRDSRSGLRGVGYYARTGRYSATVTASGVRHHLGYHDTAEQAGAVAAEARQRLMTHATD